MAGYFPLPRVSPWEDVGFPQLDRGDSGRIACESLKFGNVCGVHAGGTTAPFGNACTPPLEDSPFHQTDAQNASSKERRMTVASVAVWRPKPGRLRDFMRVLVRAKKIHERVRGKVR
jgi:hypothetical protein